MFVSFIRLWVFVTLALLANGNLTDVLNNVNDSHIRQMLESLRQRMCYDDPKGLPQLEPLAINKHIPLQINNDLGSMSGYVRNLHITGLSDFVIDDVSFHIAGFEFDIKLTIPKLTVSGEYASNGLFAATLFNVDAEDRFTLEMCGLRVRTKGAFVFDNNEWSLKVSHLEPALDKMVSKFEGLHRDKEANEFLNDVISKLSPKYFKEYLSPDILLYIKSSVQKVGKSLFRSETALDLIDLLTGEKSLFSPLDQENACIVNVV